jgi:hypothetical protein
MTPEREDDPGEPIAALAELRLPASGNFLGKVRARIHRRALASNLVDMAWSAPAQVLLEFLNILFGLLGRKDTERGGK